MVRRLIPELEVQGKVREADELRHDLVQLLASMGKIEECENVSRLAVEAAEKRNDRRTRLLFEFSLLRCLRLEGKWEEAVTKTEACVKTAHDLGDFKTGCSLLYFLSALHSDLLQDKQSLAALKRAKELAESQGDPYLNALFTGSEGMMLRDIGQAAKGEPLLRTAVKYFAESGYKRMESSFLGGLASVQFNLKRYRDAQETAQAALRIAADAGNLRELHAAQGLVGISLTMAGQFQEGLSMLNVAAATAKASNDQVYAATWSGHGAIALLAMGNHAGCVERMRSVMSAFNALGRKESAEMLNKQLREHAHDLKLSLPTSL
jgi:tetratricopeptide (TPR) repeat protein